jgi:glycosyltransferase involved in cell wall biosynthesis
MVGNWGKGKRHASLFQAVAQMEIKPRIALIGYPLFGRTQQDVMAEASRSGVLHLCTFYEKIPPEKVAQILSQSKINVLLSLAEGANRGIYEGMFCGNVIVVFEKIKGVNLHNINPQTGYLATDKNLPMVLTSAIKNFYKFDTRKWALANIGYINSTQKLNNILKDKTITSGCSWGSDIVPKKNVPNLRYTSGNDRLAFQNEFKNLAKFLLTN